MVLLQTTGCTTLAGLVKAVFSKNAPDVIDISIPHMQTSKQLFRFCVDLLMHGIVELHGHGRESIGLHEITRDEFMDAAGYMYNAGIDCNLLVEQRQTPGPLGMNLKELSDMPSDLPLEDYQLVAELPRERYVLTFRLFHRTPAPGCKVPARL